LLRNVRKSDLTLLPSDQNWRQVSRVVSKPLFVLPLMSSDDATLIEICNILDKDIFRNKKHGKSFDFY
jgi:hypothetical protein